MTINILTGEKYAGRVHSNERESGKRARFHVYYRDRGRIRFDPSWRPTAEEATSDISAFLKLLVTKNAEIIGVAALDPATPLEKNQETKPR